MSFFSTTARARSLGLILLALASGSLCGGDDKPKPDKGSPAGEVHGGEGGESFRDMAEGRLRAIKIRAGDYVDSISCAWTEDGTTTDGVVHGGEGGEENMTRLDADEYIEKVSGVVLDEGGLKIIASLTIKTNKRTLGPYGQANQAKAFHLEAPKGEEICGFRGRSGQYLDAIGIVTRPRP